MVRVVRHTDCENNIWQSIAKPSTLPHITVMENDLENTASSDAETSTDAAAPKPAKTQDTKAMPVERGGPKGPEPTRYGDWENGGRCTDF